MTTLSLRSWFVLCVAPICAATICPAALSGEPAARAAVSGPELLARIAGDESLEPQVARLVARAREDLRRGVVGRPRTLDELFSSELAIRYREKPAHLSEVSEENWTRFALSLGDVNAGNNFSTRLPRLAAAYVFSGDAVFLERLTAQLAELATWAPLQRPGWSIRNTNPTIPAEGDGAWLGTGWAVRGIVDALELLPAGALPAEVRAAVLARLDDEVARIMDDFRTGRPWYVRGDAVHTNQWVLPNEALVRATLLLGVDAHREAYEFGVTNLLRSFEAQGANGEFIEGHAYAAITLTGLLSAARATARAGDTRLIEHLFLRNFPTWFAHHAQPGGRLINAFDSGHKPVTSVDFQNLLSSFMVATGDPVALWTLRNHTGFTNGSLEGLYAQTLPASLDVEPALYAHYPVATRVNWRDSWDNAAATGFWMRGGHETDFHDHMDRGHVNFIVGGRPILIEAGVFNYGLRNHPTHYVGVAGHNVLQVGDAPPEKLRGEAARRAGQVLDRAHRAASITVERMDALGGAASVDVSGAYPSVKKWVRRVEWDRDGLVVRDEVELHEPEVVLFRWHLGLRPGEAGEPVVADGAMRFTGAGFVIESEGDAALVARMESMPDATLEISPKAPGEHACLVVRSAGPVGSLTLTTRLRVTRRD